MQEYFVQEHTSYLTIPKWKRDNIFAGITTRSGGMSNPPFHSFNQGLHVQDHPEDILHNRKKLAALLDYPLNDWVSGEQVHGTNIAIVHACDKGKGATNHKESLSGIDGLITTEKNLLLTAFFADCVPLYFYDRKNKVIGLAHAGWRGTVLGMGPNMVKEFLKLGTSLDDLEVVIGPCISNEYYEVDDHVVSHIPKVYQASPIINPSREGHYLLDLKRLHKEMLKEAGIPLKNIEMTHYCTYKNQDLFFSHRRDSGKTGRMLAFIGISDS